MAWGCSFLMKTLVNHTQTGAPYGVGVHVKDRHSGEEVIGKELGSSPGKREVRCSAAREMCVSRGYLSSLVPGVATVSTSPHYTACYSRRTTIYKARITISVQAPVNSFGVPFRSLKTPLSQRKKGTPPTYIFCFLLHHDKAALCPM